MNSYINKFTERDKTYVLMKSHTDETYLSFILMPQTLYSKLSDLLMQEDVDYFWGLHYEEIDEAAYSIFTKKMFQNFGRKVNIKSNNYWFWIIGSIPEQLIPYLREIK